jgi:hypothetical protein
VIELRVKGFQEMGESLRLIGKGEEKIDTAHLRVAHMIAAFAILPIMPFDLVFGEMEESTLADAGEEVLLGMLEW